MSDNNVRIIFSEEVWNIQRYLVDKIDIEVSWLCAVKDLGMNSFNQREYFIYELFLLDQVCTGASTEIDASAIAKLISSMDEEKADELLFWGHSHVNMGVAWSAVDETQVSDFLKNGNFIISYVFNKRGEFNKRIDTIQDIYKISNYTKIETVIQKKTMTDLVEANVDKIVKSLDFDIENSDAATIIKAFIRKIPKDKQIVDTPLSDELKAYWSEQIKAKVKKKEYPVATYSGKRGSYGHWDKATNSYVEVYGKDGLLETEWVGAYGESQAAGRDDGGGGRDRLGNADSNGKNGAPSYPDLGSRQDRGSQSAKSVLSNKRRRKGKG